MTTTASNKKMEMEFGLRVATHSILKDINSGRNGNLVFSPLSLHTAMNLLTAGAEGRTLDQLLRFLDSENVSQLNAQSSLFMELATASTINKPSDETPTRDCGNSGPIISMVNGIWVDRCISLKHSFKQLADNVYKAKSESVDFTQVEQVVEDINLWAKEASKGHIDEFVSSDQLEGAILVLANALYFKGSWLQPFDASETEDEDFRLLNGKRVRVPFMKQWNIGYFYRSFEGFKLLKMEYEEGHNNKCYAMHIFLPDHYDGLQELIQKFHSNPNFFTDNHKLEYVWIDKLWLPKLKYDYGLDMTSNIMDLGLDLPFQQNAEFTKMVGARVCVSKVIQKSFIELNEEGTIATSATAITFLVGGAAPRKKPPPLINFIADHPFLFVIKEETSKVVLFVGAALNPLS